MKQISFLLALLIVAGCSYPHEETSTVDTRPHLSISNAPGAALLTVDGVSLGNASNYAPDEKQLILEHGTHHVVVSVAGAVLYNNSVYLGDGTNRTIALPQ
jgi:hypothetical protein